MIEKRDIEDFMKANGLPPTAKDEEIRSVLLSAQWNKNEVDTAMTVMRENTQNKVNHTDILHKVFNSDNRLDASEISSLLGIDVKMTSDDVNNINQKHKNADKLLSISIFVLSFVIALSSISFLMYKEKAGIFYQTKDKVKNGTDSKVRKTNVQGG